MLRAAVAAGTAVGQKAKAKMEAGVKAFFPGPYYEYINANTVGDKRVYSYVDDALKHIKDKIAKDGPYDALLGFSQGGMMSLHCGLHMAQRPQAVVSFSGALLGVGDIAEIEDRPSVMLIHGTDDQVVPFTMMQAASTILATHGIEATCVTRPGLGHGIDPDALTRAIDFLAMHLPG